MATSPEAMLLSSILRDRDYTTATICGVTPEMFTAYPDEWNWVAEYVGKHKKVPTKNAFKAQFPDFRVKAVNDSAHFADEVRRQYARRMMTKAMNASADLLADGLLTDAVESIQRSAVEVGAALSGVQDKNFSTDWEHIYGEVERRKERFDQFGRAGIPTGFETFDDRAGGLVPGQLAVIAARLGVGKSWTLIYMAMVAMMNGDKAHYSSLEMSNAEVGMRLHNFLSGAIGKQVFTAQSLAQGTDFDLIEYKRFLRDVKSSMKGQLTMSDTRRIGLTEIAAQIERHQPDIYFLDYLTLARMRGDGGWKDIGDFTKGLKDLAKETNTVIVTAAQLNRQAAGSKGMADSDTIGGSDQIGQDADVIITAKKHSESVLQYKLVKHRQGRANYHWWMNLDLQQGVFREVSYNDAQDMIDRDKDRADDEF